MIWSLGTRRGSFLQLTNGYRSRSLTLSDGLGDIAVDSDSGLIDSGCKNAAAISTCGGKMTWDASTADSSIAVVSGAVWLACEGDACKRQDDRYEELHFEAMIFSGGWRGVRCEKEKVLKSVGRDEVGQRFVEREGEEERREWIYTITNDFK